MQTEADRDLGLIRDCKLVAELKCVTRVVRGRPQREQKLT